MITLKANELNVLIYKYFLESGLCHSAYTLLHESNLMQSLQELKFDVKAGHLLTVLEKGLIFSQIQAHVSFNEYQECLEPFNLIKSHSCMISDKIIQDRNKTLQEMAQSITESIKRTNSIYHTSLPNQRYDEIVYEAKSSRFMDKFAAKIKLPVSTENNITDVSQRFVIDGKNKDSIALYDFQQDCISVVSSSDNSDEISLVNLYPCINQGKLQKLFAFEISSEYVVQVYNDNYITLMPLDSSSQLVQYKSSLKSQITSVKSNPSIKLQHIVCLSAPDSFEIMSTKNFTVIKTNKGQCVWRAYDEFIQYDKKQLELKTLMDHEPRIRYNIRDLQLDEILMSIDKNYFCVVSYQDKAVNVYTFENKEPLYMFRFDTQCQIKQVLWTKSKYVEYLTFLTDKQIRVWQISLNAFSKIIDISQYDSQVSQLFQMQKNSEEMYLTGWGTNHLIFYDINNAKIERMEIQGKVSQVYTQIYSRQSINGERLIIICENCMYFVKGTQIEPLFN